MRGRRIASHQPSLYIERFPTASKYCCVWRSGAFASASESANVKPCRGSCSIPSTCVGAGMPTISSTVGAMSITCVKWLRRPPASETSFGYRTTSGLRVPPRCEATCLPQLNGQFPAHAQAAE
jgi:hypothetical protein